MSLQDLSKHLREARRARGLSQEALATAAGVRTATVGDIERGAVAASVSTILQLATALDVAPGTLLDGPFPASDLSKNEREVVSGLRLMDDESRRHVTWLVNKLSGRT